MRKFLVSAAESVIVSLFLTAIISLPFLFREKTISVQCMKHLKLIGNEILVQRSNTSRNMGDFFIKNKFPSFGCSSSPYVYLLPSVSEKQLDNEPNAPMLMDALGYGHGGKLNVVYADGHAGSIAESKSLSLNKNLGKRSVKSQRRGGPE